MPTWPPTPVLPLLDGDAGRELEAAQATLDVLTIAQTAERDDLLAQQRQELTEHKQTTAQAQRALDALGPQQELEQQAAQLAIDQASQALADTQDAQAESDNVQRAAERVHAAEAALNKARNALERLLTAHSIARQQAEADLAAAQNALDMLPDVQAQALARLDAAHKAAMLLASNRVERANAQVEEARRARERAQEGAAATATAQAQAHQLAITATTQAHLAAVTATAALPTPAPNHIVSRAGGRVVAVTAEEQEGKLIVTLEVMP